MRILVVGNPCNTNCLIARSNAPEVPADRWFAMTRLDENRAKAQLAHKAGAPVGSVTNVAIWGNHSATQFPDFANARIGGEPATEVITDHEWLQGDFITTVQKRGAAIIEARGSSSAASAASAAIDTVVSLRTKTAPGDCHLGGRGQLRCSTALPKGSSSASRSWPTARGTGRWPRTSSTTTSPASASR